MSNVIIVLVKNNDIFSKSNGDSYKFDTTDLTVRI